MKNLLAFFKHFFCLDRNKFVLSVFLNVVLGLTRGFSLISLIPLLNFSEDNSSKLTLIDDFSNKLLTFFGFELSNFNLLLIIIILGLFQIALKFCLSILETVIIENFIKKLKFGINSKLLFAPFSFYKKRNNVEINSIILNQIELIGFGGTQIIQSISSFVFLLIYFSLAFFISFKFTLIALFLIVLLFLLNKFLLKKSLQIGEEEFALKQDEYRILNEQILLIKEIKLKGKENYFFTKMKISLHDYFSSQVKFSKIQAFSTLLFEISLIVVFIFIFYFLHSEQKINFFELIFFIYLLSRCVPLASSLSSNFINLNNVLPSYFQFLKLNEELDLNNEKNLVEVKLKIVISEDILVRNLNFGYSPNKSLFVDFCCQIKFQQINILKGNSGIGKTSLIEMITGLQSNWTGEIFINNLNVNGKKIIFNEMVYISQETQLINASIFENLRFLNDVLEENEILDFVSKHLEYQFLLKFENGLSTIIGENGIQLSGGERQRLSLLRAFLLKPNFLILDEATSALDYENESLIFEYLKSLDITIILVSHRESIENYADNVILIN